MEKISGVLSLSLSKRSRGGEERKENEGGGGCFHSRGGVLFFLRYTSLPRVGRVLSVEGKEEDIYICAVSRQIFKVA